MRFSFVSTMFVLSVSVASRVASESWHALGNFFYLFFSQHAFRSGLKAITVTSYESLMNRITQIAIKDEILLRL